MKDLGVGGVLSYFFPTVFIHSFNKYLLGFPGGAVVGSPPAGAGDTGSGPGLGGSRVPWSGWARGPRLLGLRVWSLCSAAGGAAVVGGPRAAGGVAPACRGWRGPSHGDKDPTQP